MRAKCGSKVKAILVSGDQGLGHEAVKDHGSKALRCGGFSRGKVNLDQGHFEIVSIGDRTEDSGKVSIIKSRQCYHCGGPVFEGKLQ